MQDNAAVNNQVKIFIEMLVQERILEVSILPSRITRCLARSFTARERTAIH
jgi:hypothetical protein